MCGIVGMISFKRNSINSSLLFQMNHSIRHRGIDDEGYILIDQNEKKYKLFSGEDSDLSIKEKFPSIQSATYNNFSVGLGHRRFSIIDPTISGHQPFLMEDGSCCTVFNGEIYNYIEIKKELLKEGYFFNTNSDTEVLLKAYKAWGEKCFSYFNGFWALAIYDFNANQLILCRDRLGKKPLYWTIIDQIFYFASEIKALLNLSVYNTLEVNNSVVNQWLLYGLRDISNDTFFKNIFSFPSASYAIIDKNVQHNSIKYWTPSFSRLSEKELSIKEASSELRKLLEDSIKLRLRSDVPWCVELSGGMDSSCITALASKKSNMKINSFTVKFEEEEWNEEKYARIIAEKYNTNYIVINSPTDNFWDNIKEFTYLEEEPYHSPNLQTNQVVWSLMRDYGIKVSLNGAGGDELFAGYGNYYAFSQLENLKNKRYCDFINNLSWTENKKVNSFIIPFYIYAKHSNIPILTNIIKNFRDNSSYFNNLNSSFLENNAVFLSDVLISDIFTSKIPYWLRSGDKGFMGIPFEVRAPFLDYRVVEFALKLPSSYLVKNGWHKWILRKSVEDILPPQVNWRKKKLGFPFPLREFLTKNDKIVEEIFIGSSNPFINYKYKKELKFNWNVISFLLWYEYFINKNNSLFEKIVEISNSNKSAKIKSQYKPLFLSAFK